MNGRLRLILCGACVAIGAFHAPWATHVFVEDLAGTYAFVVRTERASSAGVRVATALNPTRTEMLDAAQRDDARTGRTPHQRR